MSVVLAAETTPAHVPEKASVIPRNPALSRLIPANPGLRSRVVRHAVDRYTTSPEITLYGTIYAKIFSLSKSLIPL